MAEIEEILSRFKGHEQVQGYVIINQKGDIIRTTYMDSSAEEGNKLASIIPELVFKTRAACQFLGKDNNLQFMRVKTSKYELLIAPDSEFILIVVQTNSKSNTEKANDD